jgi:hypothetical protein
LTLTVLFFVSVLPTLEESWQWVAEDCYVYAHTSFPAVSALVTLAVCSPGFSLCFAPTA